MDGAAGQASDGGAARPGAVARPAGAGPVEPAADLPTALAAAIADPGGRIELHAGDAIDALAPWLADQPAVGAGARPRRPASAGRHGARPRPRRAGRPDRGRRGPRRRRPTAPSRRTRRRPARRPRGQAAPRRPVRRGSRGRSRPRSRFDTQIAAYILNASLRSQTIADVVAEQLDLILPPAKELPPFARAGLEALSAIAARDPLGAALEREGLDRLFREIELPLIPVLARMEATGVALDREALALLDREFGAEIERLEAEIYASVGHEFNLGSPKQLEQVLFFELNLPKGKRTKTGYSTDASVLEDLRAAHPMVDGLLEWRTYTKLRSTYVEALPTLIAADGRLHTTFHQAVAATGRLSLVRPEPPEHPDPDRARPADPARVRGRRRRT